jgi:2',3'-cyclic-nucleotide 2'-phosphodiesterase (5'-nucleotidase family)
MSAWSSILFVQINDFYHIDYLLDSSDRDSMILPRLRTILVNLRKLLDFGMVAHFSFCLPGDFLSPSCLSRHFRGRQMIDLLNRLELNFAIFGNHEFDFEKKGFQPKHLYKCLAQSEFDWICSNFEFSGIEYAHNFERHAQCADVASFESGDHRVYMFGLLYEQNFPPFGRTLEPIATCRRLIKTAKDSQQEREPVFIAMTHQTLDQDRQLAAACPELRLIMGGHDHDVAERDRQSGCLIVKAKSNARSIRLNWLIRMSRSEYDAVSTRLREVIARDQPGKDYDPLKALVVYQFVRPAVWTAITGEEKIDTNHPRFSAWERYVQKRGLIEGPGIFRHRIGDDYLLVFSTPFDSEMLDFVGLVSEDRNIREAIDGWVNGYPGGKTVIATTPVELSIRDQMVRSRSTNFGNLVADIVRSSYPRVDIGVVNGGSFRLGRNIKAGEPITGRTLCEIFYHANDIRIYRISGVLVRELLLQSLEHCHGGQEGHGDFLQLSGAAVDAQQPANPHITVGGSPLQLDRPYLVATTKYVAERAYKEVFRAAELLTIAAPSIRDVVEQGLKQGSFLPDETARWIS